MAGFNAFLKSNNIVTGTQIPTEGNYKTGDIVVNIGPNSAAEPMWICNEGGNPGVWGPVGVGGGSGSIVSINSSVMIDEPTNEIPLDSLGVIVTKKDKLLVHYNSVHLLEGVHFEIAGEGTKIVKLGEGSWNEEGLEDCMFAFELFKGVQNIEGNEITVASKMVCKTNHVIIENPCGEVEIGIEGFKSENDTLMVFKNGVIMVEGVDYTIEGDIITSTGEVWNENGIEDYGMTFVVFKEIILYEGDSGTIKMDHLAEDVKEAIENASNIDLSGYQSKEDEELVTNNKTVIGAINELFQNANNGKELIANAIGEPLSKDDTFSAMSNDINSLLSTFKTNMMNNGVTVESNDKFKSLIDKIATMVEEGSGKGIQFASGKYNVNYETRLSSITISTNANFVPTYVFCEVNIYKYDSYTQESISGIMSNLCSITARGNSSLGITMTDITADSFTLNWSNPSPGSYKYTALSVGNWYVIGVGEEDTTLRDSLASILQEEGVSVTEEDDMASLISKVDEEFNRQVVPAGDAVASNVLTGKTFINSTGSTLTGTMTEHGYYTDYAGYFTTNDVNIFVGIQPGAYLSSTGSGYPEILIPKSRVNNLSPENIVSGKEILGVWGTASTSSYVSGSDSTYKSTPGKQIVERVTIQTNLGFVPSNLIVRFKSNSSYGYEMQYFTVCSALNTNKATGVFFNLGISAWFYLENVNANSFDIVSEVSNQNYSMRYSEIQWMAYK